MGQPTATPVFPLGGVLFPGGLLPLRVFEPRYRTMVDDLLAGEPEFVVVLIARGREVGGGDTRTGLGTMARILHVGRSPDGRAGLLAVGTRRVRVTTWLPDDPYPRAEIEDWPDDAPLTDLSERLEQLRQRLDELAVVTAEFEGQVGPEFPELPDDPVEASYLLADRSPLGPADRQRLLGAPGPAGRLDLLDSLLDDAEAVLRFRRQHGGEVEPPGV